MLLAVRDVLWTSLIGSLQSDQCVLVLGPEIPAMSGHGAPSSELEMESIRDGFCRYLAKQLQDENQPVGESALFAIAQQYEDFSAFATVNLKQVAARFFRDSHYKPGPLHLMLAALPFSLVLTTCHDDLFLRALADTEKSPSRYTYHFKGEPRDNRELDAAPTPDTPIVYHLIGEFHEPNSLVLTENDLLDFIIHVISGRPKLPDSLRSALRNKTFLFVGFGIRHWYIRVLLKLLIRTLDLAGGSVALEPLGSLDVREREQTVLFYKRGTRLEVIDVDIATFLSELRERFERAGGFLGRVLGVPRRAHVFISYERADARLARQLFEALPKDQFEPWLDAELLEGGVEWDPRLEEKVHLCDYFVVLHSERLAQKQVGYVNKEIKLALDQQMYRQQGLTFIIPLLVDGFAAEQGRADFKNLQQLPLRSECFEEDVSSLIRTMSRDFQRRHRRHE